MMCIGRQYNNAIERFLGVAPRLPRKKFGSSKLPIFDDFVFLESILSTPLKDLYKTITHDVYRSAIEHYEEIFWVLATDGPNVRL